MPDWRRKKNKGYRCVRAEMRRRATGSGGWHGRGAETEGLLGMQRGGGVEAGGRLLSWVVIKNSGDIGTGVSFDEIPFDFQVIVSQKTEQTSRLRRIPLDCTLLLMISWDLLWFHFFWFFLQCTISPFFFSLYIRMTGSGSWHGCGSEKERLLRTIQRGQLEAAYSTNYWTNNL